jgi:hypothetical protein
VILATEFDSKLEEGEAEKVLGILCAAYPGHPWAVMVRGGVIFIRHLQFPGNWGMNLRVKEADFSASFLKRKIIFLAGEFLERAGLARGRENGDEIVSVEGVPFKYQPAAQREPVQFETVVDARSYEPLREVPRPQVEKEMKKS